MAEFNYALEPGKYLKRKYDVRQVIETGVPLISVVTAYYNAGTYFEQTFYSVLNQTFPWFEWIIVDDGSTNEKDIAKLCQMAESDGRIKVLHQENEGAVSARNKAITYSVSDVIVILDADDLIDCRYLEMVYWGLLCNPQAAWAYTDSVGFDHQQYIWEREFSSDVMKRENVLSYIAAIRKEVLTDGIYDNRTRNEWEDWQLWLKLLAKGYRPFHIKKKMFWYRRLDTGMLSKIEKDEKLRNRLKAKIGTLAQNVPDGVCAVCPDYTNGLEFARVKVADWDRKLPYRKKKVHILFLLPHMECGGADLFNLDIIKNLDKERYENGIVTTVADENEWESAFASQTDDVFELPRFLSKEDWVSFIYYYIRSRQADIVCNISSYWGYYVLPLIRTDFPKVAVIDCVHAEGNYWRNGGYPRVSGKFSSVLERTFVTNDYTRNILVKKYGAIPDKTRLIYTGVDEDSFCAERISCEQEREKYRISAQRPTVLYLCRLCPEKRPFLMLEIARKVKERIHNIQFLVVGTGEYQEDLKRQAEKLGLQETVIFTGRVEDTKPFYKMSDLFLLCSLKEGLSVTTFESLIMGLPVIGADVGSQYELVDDQTGSLITCRADEQKDFYSRESDPKEVQEYADAVCGWVEKLRRNEQQVRQECRNKIKRGFTLKDLIHTLDREFMELISDEAVLQRVIAAKELILHRAVFEELMMLCNSYGSKEVTLNELWTGNAFQYEQFRKTEEALEQECGRLTEERNRMDLELRTIYSLRTWRMITKYHDFMENTKAGHLLSRLRKAVTSKRKNE